MKRNIRLIGYVVGLSSLVVAATAAASAADSGPVAQAMKFYEMHHYSGAASVLRTALPTLDPSHQAAGELALGMIYTKSAALHRELASAAALAQVDYFSRLARERGKNVSRAAPLFLGEALLAQNRARDAAAAFKGLLARRGIPLRDRMLAHINLGLCYQKMGQPGNAARQWNEAKSSDPEIRMALAASYGRAGMRQAGGIAESARRAAGGKVSEMMREDLLSVYANEGEVDKAFALLQHIDLNAPTYTEVLGKSDTLNFYSPYLLGDLARLDERAAIVYLNKAEQDPTLKGTAEYYLGKAYVMDGQPQAAARALDDFMAQPQFASQIRDRARVRRATVDYLLSRRAQALSEWDSMTQEHPDDVDLLAQIVLACRSVAADCPKIVTRAAMTADAGQGRRYAGLDVAVGRYYFDKQNYSKAIWYMEAGRDKGNKNKIEANDPIMLVDLASAYYKTMLYSQNLEIYFGMSSEYPEVRQIQDAVQGVYSMVQRSAGDVKIF